MQFWILFLNYDGDAYYDARWELNEPEFYLMRRWDLDIESNGFNVKCVMRVI